MSLRKIVGAVSLVCFTLGGLVVSAPSASAAYLCSPNSEQEASNRWTSKSKPWAVTHASRYEHYTSGTGTYSKTAAKQLQLTAEVTYSVSAHAGVGFGPASLGAATGLTLKATGQVTSSTSVTVTEAMTRNDVYVFFAGSHKASGAYDHYSCNKTGTGTVKKWSGTVKSWDSPAEGAVACHVTVPTTSLSYAVKLKHC